MILLLAAVAMQPPVATTVPIQARIVRLDERRTQPSGAGSVFDRLRLEFTNLGSVPVPLRICPRDARFENARNGKDGAQWHVDGTAFAASFGRRRNWRTSCQEVTLAPGRAQLVNLFSRYGSIFGDYRRMVLTTNAGKFVFDQPSVRYVGRAASADGSRTQ